MMMTEEEARGKWCPHGFLLGYEGATHGAPASVGGSYNRFDDGVPACKCIASQCMAWRWAAEQGPQIALMKSGEEHLEQLGFYLHERRPDGTSEWRKKAEMKVGFCGLAGRPEE